jgi:hypothetical protein
MRIEFIKILSIIPQQSHAGLREVDSLQDGRRESASESADMGGVAMGTLISALIRWG